MGDPALRRRLKRKRADGEPRRVSSGRDSAHREAARYYSPSLKEDDEDYLLHLKHIEAVEVDVDVRSPDRPREGKRSNADVDPHYTSFLKQLRIDAKSYTLVVEGDAGERRVFKYEYGPQEGLHVHSEGFDLPSEGLMPGSQGVSVKEECVADDENRRSALRSESSKKLRIPENAPGRKGNGKARPLKKDSRTEAAVKGLSVPSEGLTPGSQGVSAKKGRGLTLGSLGVSAKKGTVVSDGKSRSVLRGESSKKLRTQENASGRKGNDKTRPVEKASRTKEAVNVSKHPACKRRKIMSTDQDVEVQGGSCASEGRKECKRGPGRPRAVNCFERRQEESDYLEKQQEESNYVEKRREEKRQEESDEWDDDYYVFIDYLRADGGLVLFNMDNRKVRYEEDEVEESSSSSDLQILKEDILKNEVNNPFVTTRLPNIIDLDTDDLGESEHSEFREKLLERLRMRYDSKEYEELLQQVKYRRRKEIVRQLRGGREKTCITNKACESYLDQYPAQGDRRRTLNLLRGFFFYLGNLPMEGVFRPWDDRYCSNILPPLPPQVKQKPCLKIEPASNIFSPPTPPLVEQGPRLKVEPS
ncbi:uncharacterized protein LOC116187721 isoform X2 [Punica granatum]|uniref:Uncharacterized protein LOC116187721 isoform X2 n=1 Tax=Punica granatum TaxID=22663 RepID=A0A6P8BQ84_PUNGR|nr:uncharacterized protein LOC116187721 isoform X2 [Punica granatum]